MPSEPTAARFDQIVRWLRGQFQILPLPEAVRRLQSGSLPAGAAAITFDDGYVDNFDIAAPILRRHGVPATFFVASRYLDGGIMWNDVVIESLRRTHLTALEMPTLALPRLPLASMTERAAAIPVLLHRLKYLPPAERDMAAVAFSKACGVNPPGDLMMTSDQLRQLVCQDFDIGGHTHSHPILARLPDAKSSAEIETGRKRLQDITGTAVETFAYPNGRAGDDFAARHMAMVQKAGFLAAFTTEPGTSCADTHAFAMPRFTPWDRDEWRFRARLLLNLRQTSDATRDLNAVAPADFMLRSD